MQRIGPVRYVLLIGFGVCLIGVLASYVHADNCLQWIQEGILNSPDCARTDQAQVAASVATISGIGGLGAMGLAGIGPLGGVLGGATFGGDSPAGFGGSTPLTLKINEINQLLDQDKTMLGLYGKSYDDARQHLKELNDYQTCLYLKGPGGISLKPGDIYTTMHGKAPPRVRTLQGDSWGWSDPLTPPGAPPMASMGTMESDALKMRDRDRVAKDIAACEADIRDIPKQMEKLKNEIQRLEQELRTLEAQQKMGDKLPI